MQLPVNTSLQGGKYKIIRFINSGGFGCTYEAEYSLMNTRVAIKEFFVKDLCERDESTSRISVLSKSKIEVVEKLKKKFIDEARSLFQMQHPGIVRVVDIFEENGTAYYAMEFIEGISLHEAIKEQGRLSEAEAVGYVRQVADALRYVHSQSRLHLDIKPGNIMVNKAGKALLIDFGASKHYDEETGENTSTLLGVNTKGYAPPEQMTQSFTTFSPSTDIYALGATLYKLLTGITPPEAGALMSGDKELEPLPNYVSSPARNAIEQAMQPRRANRPQSIDEFLKLLDGATPTVVPPVVTDRKSTQVSESTIFDNDTPKRKGGDETLLDKPAPKVTTKATQKVEVVPQDDEEDDDNEGFFARYKSSLIILLLLLLGGGGAYFYLNKEDDSTFERRRKVKKELAEFMEVIPEETIKEEFEADTVPVEGPIEEIEFDKPDSIKGPVVSYEKKEDYKKTELVVEEKNDSYQEMPVVEGPIEEKEEEVHTFVEQMPAFPGGEVALMKYISENLRYPSIALEEGIQGRVVIRFVVEKDGSVGDIVVARGLYPACDKEAVRVVKSLPRFTPGKQNGNPVRVWFTLPITFKLM